MSGMWGNNIKVSIFGESHGNAIGINIDGLPSGFEIDIDKIMVEMAKSIIDSKKRRRCSRNIKWIF